MMNYRYWMRNKMNWMMNRDFSWMNHTNYHPKMNWNSKKSKDYSPMRMTHIHNLNYSNSKRMSMDSMNTNYHSNMDSMNRTTNYHYHISHSHTDTPSSEIQCGTPPYLPPAQSPLYQWLVYFYGS